MVQGPDGQPLDDAVAALQQIFSIQALGVSVGVSVLSIAFFNFFGVSGEGLAAVGGVVVAAGYTSALQEFGEAPSCSGCFARCATYAATVLAPPLHDVPFCLHPSQLQA
jgi:hypothetical protein